MNPFSDALYQQCVRRIRALAAKSRSDPTPLHLSHLARRIAQIAEQNVDRIPKDTHVPAYATTPFPDSYIDEIITTFMREARHVERLRNKNDDEWEALFKKITRWSKKYADPSYTPEFAKDMAVHCAALIWMKLSTYPFDTSFNSWAARFVFYEFSNYGRSADAKTESAPSWDDPAFSDPDSPTLLEMYIDPEQAEQWHQQEMVWTVRSYFCQLTPDQREVVERDLAGQATIAIAEAMKRKPSAVYTLRYNAHRKLRELILMV